ncbi:hypothetical protein AMK19_05675 [Kitasatospora sp. CB01950]|nr:hypothetical protein AMK19_05675 [Kitasatospora sp. CB01950]
MDGDQEDYRAATERAARGVPTSRPVAVAYTVALAALLALALALAMALIASGLTCVPHRHRELPGPVENTPPGRGTTPTPLVRDGRAQPTRWER